MEPMYFVFGHVNSDCGNPIDDFLGKYETEEKAKEVKEIFQEAYDEIYIEKENFLTF